MMSPALIGGLVGLAFGVADYFLLGFIKDQAGRNGVEPRRLRALDMARLLQLVMFPAIGFFAGPYVIGSVGE
jgi:hypothetical protein